MKPAEFRALRKMLGLSQNRIAMRVGTSRQCVHYFEAGRVLTPEWSVPDAISWMADIAKRRGLI